MSGRRKNPRNLAAQAEDLQPEGPTAAPNSLPQAIAGPSRPRGIPRKNKQSIAERTAKKKKVQPKKMGRAGRKPERKNRIPLRKSKILALKKILSKGQKPAKRTKKKKEIPTRKSKRLALKNNPLPELCDEQPVQATLPKQELPEAVLTVVPEPQPPKSPDNTTFGYGLFEEHDSLELLAAQTLVEMNQKRREKEEALALMERVKREQEQARALMEMERSPSYSPLTVAGDMSQSDVEDMAPDSESSGMSEGSGEVSDRARRSSDSLPTSEEENGEAEDKMEEPTDEEMSTGNELAGPQDGTNTMDLSEIHGALLDVASPDSNEDTHYVLCRDIGTQTSEDSF